MQSIFLSHSHTDKPFVRKLAKSLIEHGIRVWVDEAEIKVGDSLISKIREGLDSVDYVGVVISLSSINSKWVQYEVDIAMNQEIAGKFVKVLPILYQDVSLPGFLLGKVYADFRGKNYRNGLKTLLNRLIPDEITLLPNPSSQDEDSSAGVLIQDLTQHTTVNLRLLRLGRDYKIKVTQNIKIGDFLKIVVNELSLNKPVFLPQTSYLLGISWHLYLNDIKLNTNQLVKEIPSDEIVTLVCEVHNDIVLYEVAPPQFRKETWERILTADWTPIEAEAIHSVYREGYEKSSASVAGAIMKAKAFRPEIQELFLEILELEMQNPGSPIVR